jgi:ammonia channel protein AmtB
VVVSWIWNSGGWLNQRGYHDLAGTSVIHITGGFGGMIGAIMCGSRLPISGRAKNIDREKLLKEKEYLDVLKTIDSEEDRIIFRKWVLL